MKNLCSGTHRGEFQFLLILYLWGINFHAVVVFGLGKNLLFKSVLGRCEQANEPKLTRVCIWTKFFRTKSCSLKWNVKVVSKSLSSKNSHLAWMYFRSLNSPIPHPNAGFLVSSLPLLGIASIPHLSWCAYKNTQSLLYRVSVQWV